MFSWLKRLFQIWQAEAHSVVEKLEDPVKFSEQGIRNLKSDLDKSLKGLAEVKAISIRAKKELETDKKSMQEYENKAVLLLKKAEAGQLEPAEADRLASTALEKKGQLASKVQSGEQNVKVQDQMVAKMEGNVDELRKQISTWENELKTLKARAKVSDASKKLNEQMAKIDSSGTVAMLERMKVKVESNEALAESYADIADANKSVDDEINAALAGGESSSTAELDALKEKMRLEGASGEGDSSSTDASASTSNESGELSELDKLKQQLKDK